MIQRVAVYCSASDSVPQAYNAAAFALGRILAEAGIEVVYGDGGIGLMKQLADGALSVGGKVTGVIVTESMHERQAVITRMSDAMVALPGGVGTMAELFECLTWKQLGLHGKPIVLLNTNGYMDPVIAALDKMVAERFMQAIHRNDMFSVVSTPDEVLPAIRRAVAWGEHMRSRARTF